ncbi:hypothetical protein PHB09_073 [Pseudomonas phage PHB09]|uniref:Uncharacterized protein n=1 Tax=Pseudomonas phage PHB09 TaxID=2867265 RepID=A0AAE9BN11_9CAUD|nr:hypothetical protein QGX10_gp073 [Pseudomonas phage PHB09]UAV84569.1 hypothetical protein PHB09_073 [Pseudomonas phage PHB09]
MKFFLCLVLSSVTMFGSIFVVRTNHFDDQKMACIRSGGNGKVLYSVMRIPIGYECMRMHLVMKYRKGEYR